MRSHCVFVPLTLLGSILAQDRVSIDHARRTVHSLQPHVPVQAAGEALEAARPSYKVRFGAAVEFTGKLGESRARSAGITWRTEAARVDDVDVLGIAERPARASSDWRVELRHGAVVEAYDVREDGVEQTFTLAQPPARAGTLELIGRIDTELSAAPRRPVHGDLLFTDRDGRAVVGYGAAFAYDAAGQRIDLATGYDGERIRVVVPGEFLAGAEYPVVVDPLISVRATVMRSQTIGKVALASHPAGHVIVHEEIYSQTDRDIHAWTFDPAFQNVQHVFQDLSVADAHSPTVRVSTSLGYRPVLAYVSGNHIQLYIHQGPGVNQGISRTVLTDPFGEPADPQLAFHRGFHSTLLGYIDRDSNGHGLLTFELIDLSNGRTTQTLLHGTPLTEVRNLSINPLATAFHEPWVVAWQSGSNAGGWGLTVARLDPQDLTVGHRFSPGLATPASLVQPEVAGSDDRYLVAYVAVTPTSTGVFAQPFDYGDNDESSPARVRVARQVESLPIGPTVFDQNGMSLDDLAYHAHGFDSGTHSHWAVSYRAHSYSWGTNAVKIARLGSRGEVVEQRTLRDHETAPSHSAVCLDYTRQLSPAAFAFIYVDEVPGFGLPGIHTGFLDFDRFSAGWVPYGSGCGPASVVPRGLPLAGTRERAIGLVNGPRTSSVVLFAALTPGNLPLDFIGMFGCSLLVGPGASFDLLTDLAGEVWVELPPQVDVPDLYFQFAYPWNGNPLGVGTTGGMHLRNR